MRHLLLACPLLLVLGCEDSAAPAPEGPGNHEPGDPAPTPESLTQYVGEPGDREVQGDFQTVTAQHESELIDFDGDGFDSLAEHEYMTLPEDHYADLGVVMLGLDARSVGGLDWAHSPPIGAWQTGFDGPAESYAFVFPRPVASFGLFANDVENDQRIEVTLSDGSVEEFWLHEAVSDDHVVATTFHGFASPGNDIAKIEIDTQDFHVIDDVRFGWVPDAQVE